MMGWYSRRNRLFRKIKGYSGWKQGEMYSSYRILWAIRCAMFPVEWLAWRCKKRYGFDFDLDYITYGKSGVPFDLIEDLVDSRRVDIVGNDGGIRSYAGKDLLIELPKCK